MAQNTKNIAISELSALSGVPTSTIKYYIRENLLPGPLKNKGTRARYTARHIDRLELIKKIRQEGVSLNKVRDILKLLDNGAERGDAPKIANMKTEIIHEAIALFRRKGYDLVTIADIVDVTRIGCSTFYKNFKNKKDLFLQCIQKIISDEAKQLDAGVADSDKDFLAMYEKDTEVFFKQNQPWQDMINMLRTAAKNDPGEFAAKLEEALQFKMTLFKQRIEKGLQLGYIREVNKNLLAVMAMGIQEYCSEYFSMTELSEPQQRKIFEEAKDIILHGIVKK